MTHEIPKPQDPQASKGSQADPNPRGGVESKEYPRDRKALHEAFEAYLARLGLRQTKQRRLVLDAVLALGTHVDAETIGREAKKMDDSIGLATVYRSLQLMIGAGIIAERMFDKDRAYFELVDPDSRHHDHFICTRCGKIVEFFDAELEELQERIAQRLGYRLTDHRMDLFGDCGGKCGYVKP